MYPTSARASGPRSTFQLCFPCVLLLPLFVSFLTSLFAAQEPSRPAPQNDLPRIVRAALEDQASVLRIRATGNGGIDFFASGFLATSDGLVLTSSNIVIDATEVSVVANDQNYPAEVLFKGPATGGLAVLRTSVRGQKLSIASSQPNPNDQVSAIGWERGSQLSSDLGIVVQVSIDTISYSRNTEGRSGIGGGPLINEQGEVVGLHMGKMFGSNLAWALNIRSQLPILRKFGILDEDAPTLTKTYLTTVGCNQTSEGTEDVEFTLKPGERIMDAYAAIVEQVEVKSARVNVESIAGQVVRIHFLLQGQSRGKTLGLPGILGVPVGSCPTGHITILTKIRVDSGKPS